MSKLREFFYISIFLCSIFGAQHAIGVAFDQPTPKYVNIESITPLDSYKHNKKQKIVATISCASDERTLITDGDNYILLVTSSDFINTNKRTTKAFHVVAYAEDPQKLARRLKDIPFNKFNYLGDSYARS